MRVAVLLVVLGCGAVPARGVPRKPAPSVAPRQPPPGAVREPAPQPVAVPKATRVVRVIAAEVRACAVFDNGALQCWGGFNHDGTLGLGHDEEVRTPGWVEGIVGVTDLALGARSTCAVAGAGDVYCWGRALPYEMSLSKPVLRPARVAGIGKAIDVALGNAHACAVEAAGDVYCWGANDAGQLGSAGGDSNVPRRVAGLGKAAGVAAVNDATVAWTAGGDLFIWGRTPEGGEWDTATPRKVKGLSGVERVVIAQHQCCALTSGHEVRCFASDTLASFEAGKEHDYTAELGGLAASMAARDPKRWVGTLVFPDGRGLAEVEEVIVFNHDASARTTAGEVYSWGNPESGTVGQPPESKGFLPPTRIGGVAGAIEIAGGFLHRCVLDSSGVVSCFGEGGAGRLGTADGTGFVAATKVAGLPEVAHIAANDYCTFALDTNHVLWTWGNSWVNACGLEGGSDVVTPGPVHVPLAPLPK